MIPDNIFDPLLRSFSLTIPATAKDFASAEVIPASFAKDHAVFLQEAPVRLWYRTDCERTYEHFARRLEQELRHLRHESTSMIAGALLALYTLQQGREDSPTAAMNELLSNVVDAELSQFFVFAHDSPPAFQKFKMGEFSIGQLAVRNLRNRSRDVGSDYFELYRHRLVGKFAIERDTVQVRVVDWMGLLPKYGVEAASQLTRTLRDRSVEAYFGRVAAAQFDNFWERFDEVQQLLTAFGAPYLDERQIRQTLFAESISVFFEINGSWGSVYPSSNSGFNFNFAPVDRRIPATARSLWDDFGIDVNADLAPPLKSYSLFTAKAIRYADDGYTNESLLHFVIALELLFGGRQQIAQSVSRRVAVLVYRPLGIALADAQKMADKIYDARSGYVHQGHSVPVLVLTDARRVCDEVLKALMRRLKVRPFEQNSDNSWLKELDYIYSAQIVGKSVADEDLESCGVVP